MRDINQKTKHLAAAILDVISQSSNRYFFNVSHLHKLIELTIKSEEQEAALKLLADTGCIEFIGDNQRLAGITVRGIRIVNRKRGYLNFVENYNWRLKREKLLNVMTDVARFWFWTAGALFSSLSVYLLFKNDSLF